MAPKKKTRAKSKTTGAAKKAPKSRRSKKDRQMAEIRRLRRAHERVVKMMRRPGVPAKRPDIAAGDPIAWLMHVLFVEALEIRPEDLIPPRASDDEDDKFDSSGVPAGELQFYLRQLYTLRVRYDGEKKRHEAAAEEASADPEKSRWHEDQAERSELISATIRFIFNVSYFDAHDLYGRKVSPHLTPNWQVRRRTS